MSTARLDMRGRAPAARLALPAATGRWLPLVPFAAFSMLFLFLPSAMLFIGSFLDASGRPTLANVAHLFRPSILASYWLSIKVSAVSALGGTIFGFLLAYAVARGGLPRGMRSFLLTFSGVASNFAGVPLAFAFIATLGRVGLVTFLLKQLFGIDLYGAGFNLYSFWGLSLTYLYFQLPLMILIAMPAIDGMKREWHEACEGLGASRWQYWRFLGFPILLPSLLSSAVLLFGNAFGAYATAYALTGGFINLITIQIGAQMRGDVLHDPNLGYALALGMVAVTTATVLAYSALQRKASRWRA